MKQAVESTTIASSLTTQAEKRKWWEVREQLDNDLAVRFHLSVHAFVSTCPSTRVVGKSLIVFSNLIRIVANFARREIAPFESCQIFTVRPALLCSVIEVA